MAWRGLTLTYTAYYPHYNAETFFTQPYNAKDYRYLSHGSHDIENKKYGNQHPLSLHPIIPSSGAAKKGQRLVHRWDNK
jgi:hypothetical protein